MKAYGMLVLTLAWTPFAPLAQGGVDSLERRGLEIAREADRRDSGFQDSRADVEMVIRRRQGNETRRRMEIMVLEGKQDGDKTLVRFLSPPDVRGTALLTDSKRNGEADQWLYLPALKRTKRISSANRSGPFMGSEFAYEDFSGRKVEDYSYRYIRSDSLAGMPVRIVERRPVYAGSGYSRQWVWWDSVYRIQRIEYWDRKDQPLKILALEGYRKYLDAYWRPEHMVMVNRQTGDTSRLDWTDLRFKNNLNANTFNSGGMGSLP